MAGQLLRLLFPSRIDPVLGVMAKACFLYARVKPLLKPPPGADHGYVIQMCFVYIMTIVLVLGVLLSCCACLVYPFDGKRK